ncbi:MAG TPA: glycosyltransferase 87 family protein [Polyangia bacterium]
MSRRRDVILGSCAVAAVTAFAAVAAFALVQQDLVAFWVAGRVCGLGLDPYVNHAVAGTVPPALWDGGVFHHSRFLYPPLAAELFRPLALLPYRAAKVVFTIAVVAAWLAASLLLARGRPGAKTAILVAGALAFPVWLNLERGQIDLLLLPLIVLAWRVRDRALVAGALLALAAVFKPALLGVVPVLAALGRWRWAGAVAAACAVAALATVALSGRALAREYAVSVLPRAVLYGEGGTDEMLYHERELERFDLDELGERQTADGRSYLYTLPLFDRPVSASLPRLLAPESPSWATSWLPYLIGAAGLAWAGARLARRRPDGGDAELVLFGAALVACVVASPTGWAMGLVWALPLAPRAWAAPAEGPAPARARWPLRAAWIACALPPLFGGWAALAGTALVLAAVAAALARDASA